IRLPTARLAQLQLLRSAFDRLPVGGHCYVAGGTDEGVKTVARTMARVFGSAQAIAHGGGHRVILSTKRAATPASDDLDDPLLEDTAFHSFDARVRGIDITVHTRPGVFSWEHVDEA